MGIGAQWVALARLADVQLDGWCLLRVKDIQSVGIEPESFEVKVLRARDQWPPASAEVNLDDVVGAITSAAVAALMISVFVEFYRPGICWIGAVTDINDERLRLLEVDTQAEWHRKVRAIDPADVTRVDFGGSYEEALALIAGHPPAE